MKTSVTIPSISNNSNKSADVHFSGEMGGCLVNITKSTSMPENSGFQADLFDENGLFLNNLSSNAPNWCINKSQEIRAERFILQSQASLIVSEHRVKHCYRRIANKTQDINIKQADNKAFLTNLQLCGSPWDCPVCSAKISERRRDELLKAVEVHKKAGGEVFMLTLTFPHKDHDNLQELMTKLRRAINSFVSGRRYNGFKSKFGFVGSIRALEVTHGENGWHPHFHILMLFSPIETTDFFKYQSSLIKKIFIDELIAKGYLPELAQDEINRSFGSIDSFDIIDKASLYKPYIDVEIAKGLSLEEATAKVALQVTDAQLRLDYNKLAFNAKKSLVKSDLAFKMQLAIREYYLQQMQEILYTQWANACHLRGLPTPSVERGVHIQEADEAARYIAKFGVEPSEKTKEKIAKNTSWDATRELVNSNSKRAIGKKDREGFTPFDLLRISSQVVECPPSYTKERASALFREFSLAFFRFRQLFWSKGLKELLLNQKDVNSESDLADPDSPDSELIYTISHIEWRAVLYSGKQARSNLLITAEKEGAAGIKKQLKQLVKQAKKNKYI